MRLPAYATAEQIHAARPDVPLGTIRNMIGRGAPWFPGARTVGRSRVVPLKEAEHFCEHYVRYGKFVVPERPSRRPGTTSPSTPRRKPDES